jgi:folate-dependent phosphoribosylglycinamide formyltransferase PurN
VTFKIVALVGPGVSSWILLDALKSEFLLNKVFIERDSSRSRLWLRRVRNLGTLTVIGQLLFLPYYAIQQFLCHSRVKQILREANLARACERDVDNIEFVDSINSDGVCSALRELQPDVVVINGTRILTADILKSCNAIFINCHAGITPMYRGSHGGYWALVNGDPLHCGVTVHQVDKGIDTGKVIYQACIEPTAKDYFSTYPYLQLAAGIPLLIKAIHDVRNGALQLHFPVGVSKLYYLPTLWGYLLCKWRNNVR